MSGPSPAQVVKHSSQSVEHFTPHDVVDRARRLLGGIDLDPASCPKANEIVRAERIFTKDDDGLSRRWLGRVWCNPPGGKIAGKSLAKLFWEKLVASWLARDVSEACFLAFNMEMLQTTQIGGGQPMGAFPFCVPSRRIAFLYVEADGDEHFTVGGGPTHANVVAYLPTLHVYSAAGSRAQLADFAEAFSSLGFCKTTCEAPLKHGSPGALAAVVADSRQQGLFE